MLQLRGKTGSPHKGDGTLSQSSEETFDAVLARLQTNRCACDTSLLATYLVGKSWHLLLFMGKLQRSG